MDPLEREAKMDELLARILIANDLKQAQGYAQQVIQLREQAAQEMEEILAAINTYCEKDLKS